MHSQIKPPSPPHSRCHSLLMKTAFLELFPLSCHPVYSSAFSLPACVSQSPHPFISPRLQPRLAFPPICKDKAIATLFVVLMATQPRQGCQQKIFLFSVVLYQKLTSISTSYSHLMSVVCGLSSFLCIASGCVCVCGMSWWDAGWGCVTCFVC